MVLNISSSIRTQDGIFCVYKDKTLLKDEAIASGKTMQKNIAPENLAKTHITPRLFFSTGSWWYHKELPIGTNGIIINLLMGNNPISEKMEIEFVLK